MQKVCHTVLAFIIYFETISLRMPKIFFSQFLISRGYAKHRNDYLLGDRLCKCVTHSDVNFWPRTWRVWVRVSCRSGHFGSCGSVL